MELITILKISEAEIIFKKRRSIGCNEPYIIGITGSSCPHG